MSRSLTPFLGVLLASFLSAQEPAKEPPSGKQAGERAAEGRESRRPGLDERRRMPSAEEVFAHLAASYDKDGDGSISRAEYPRGGRSFANLDRDGDGAITLRDLKSRRPARSRPREDAGAAEKPKPLPAVGDPAPDFELPMLGMMDQKVKLSSFRGKRPVALIFGSYT
ncbi:MAG: hypothetical protein Fur0037_17380 [Planctomycetota bacterium]